MTANGLQFKRSALSCFVRSSSPYTFGTRSGVFLRSRSVSQQLHCVGQFKMVASQGGALPPSWFVSGRWSIGTTRTEELVADVPLIFRTELGRCLIGTRCTVPVTRWTPGARTPHYVRAQRTRIAASPFESARNELSNLNGFCQHVTTCGVGTSPAYRGKHFPWGRTRESQNGLCLRIAFGPVSDAAGSML